MMKDKSTVPIKVFTDGSCLNNPGPGGWAAIILDGENWKELSGFEAETTNNRMELLAALSAIKHIKAKRPIEIHTDSQYLKRGITEWLPNWKARGWKRKGGKLANIDLWQALDKALLHHSVTWHWVRGHNGHRLNERADLLARQAIKNR